LTSASKFEFYSSSTLPDALMRRPLLKRKKEKKGRKRKKKETRTSKIIKK